MTVSNDLSDCQTLVYVIRVLISLLLDYNIAKITDSLQTRISSRPTTVYISKAHVRSQTRSVFADDSKSFPQDLAESAARKAGFSVLYISCFSINVMQ